MNDAEYEALTARLRTFTDNWVRDLIPSNVEARRFFHRTEAVFREAWGDDPPKDMEAFARTQWMYLQVDLHFNVEKLWRDNLSDVALEALVVHELLHYPLDIFVTRDDLSGQQAKDWGYHLEQAVSSLAYAVIAVRDRARGYEPVEGEY